jgi:SAM-dependent methyltransferase
MILGVKIHKHRKARSHGLDELIFRTRDITREIELRLNQGQRVRILDVGSGYGLALLELRQRYGDQVELAGITLPHKHDAIAMMKSIAVSNGIFSKEEIQQVALPIQYHFDVCAPWPLPDDSYDLVFSQRAFLWFEDKVKCLEEINRVLAPGGLALLDLNLRATRQPREQTIVLQTEPGGITFRDYIKQFDSLHLVTPRRTMFSRLRRWTLRLAGRSGGNRARSYLEMVKAQQFDLGLEFVGSHRFSVIAPPRKGVQSIYRLKRVHAMVEPPGAASENQSLLDSR